MIRNIRRALNLAYTTFGLVLTIISLFSAPAFAADCERPELPTFDAISYYQKAQGKQGKALHQALNQILADQTSQPLACAAGILGNGDIEPQTVWPRERGFTEDIQDAYSDLHNLLILPSGTDLKGGDSETWRLAKPLRGKVARALMYMAVRYDGDDASLTPNLELIEAPVTLVEPRLGRLCALLRWHQSNPPDETERRRNGIVYGWQGNRNPFVDHPEYVAEIWGHTCSAPPIQARILERIHTIESELQALKAAVEEAFGEGQAPE